VPTENISHEELNAFYKKIGQNVAKYREEKGVSQIDLAHGIGHKSTTIISLSEISNKKHFNLEHLYKIAKFLDIDICDLLK
jgi:ribosome-binding protein aMBF1 (putative translation factor)